MNEISYQKISKESKIIFLLDEINVENIQHLTTVEIK